jgi:glycosyltransferase involved in cell wall biosynthesis
VAVYNDPLYLRASLEGVLAQEGVDLEVVAVDDGSTDESPGILAELARRDPRLRVLRVTHGGLTRALVAGCEAARGRYVARHDADDLSLPGRLEKQAALLERSPDLAFVSCSTVTIGPGGEPLYTRRRTEDPAEAGRDLVEAPDGAPIHGAVMFRLDAYRRAGGYRPQFRYAQDHDLWLRLLDQGAFAFAPEVLYAFRIRDGSISTSRRGQQGRLASLARRCREARRAGTPEDGLLAEAERVSAEPAVPARRGSAGSSYFIGRCLMERRDRRASGYIWRSVRREPLAWRPWAALPMALLGCWRRGEVIG